jgi:hypothetical protein
MFLTCPYIDQGITRFDRGSMGAIARLRQAQGSGADIRRRLLQLTVDCATAGK